MKLFIKNKDMKSWQEIEFENEYDVDLIIRFAGYKLDDGYDVKIEQ